MARVFDMDFADVRLVSRDFAGNKFGPDNRQFAIEIEDHDLAQKLINDGVSFWRQESKNEDEGPKMYMNVKVSYRFGSPDIAMITPDGNAVVLTESTVHELDSAWIKGAELHVHGSTYERGARSGVTVYLDTLIVHLMSQEEQDEIRAENQFRGNPIRDKYKNIFGE